MIKKVPKIYTAGGIVNCKGRVLMIFKNAKWNFPKGRIKKNTEKKENALREVCEETNLDLNKLKIVEKLPTTHHFKIEKNKKKIIKITYWYAMSYSGSLNDVKPQIKEGIYGCVWFGEDDLSFLSKNNTHYRVAYLINFWLKSR